MKNFILFILIVFNGFLAFTQNSSSVLGARAAGMGGSSLTNKDTWAIFNNPAAFADNDKMCLGVFYENKFLMKATSSGAFAFTMPLMSGNVGISASFSGYHLYNSTKISYGYSKKLFDFLSLGANINYYSTRQAEEYGNLNALSFELGVLAHPLLSQKEFSLAAFIGNPLSLSYIENSDMKLPVVLKLGASYLFYNSLLISLETGKSLNGYTSAFKAGAEYRLQEKFSFRGGLGAFPFEYSFGFGYNELNLSKDSNLGIDVAFAYHEVLGVSPKLSISYEF